MTFNTTIEKLKKEDSVQDKVIDMLKLTYPTITRIKDIKREIIDYLQDYKDDTIVVVEDNYIDKVYRDTFSHFYATKLFPYPEYCVRFSFLSPDFPEKDFGKINNSKVNNLYLGFMVVRPIYPGTIGRTCVNKDIKENGNSYGICKVPIRSSVLGYKVWADGFPHSSQDDQYSTCAETSVWSLMEYYGNKYPEYTPILPSQIHELLKSLSRKKRVPSTGLLFDEIVYLIQNSGLECEIYNRPSPSNKKFTEKDFYHVFSCYIESGIPLLIHIKGDKGLGHAIVCIGKENWKRTEIDSTPKYSLNSTIFRMWEDVKGNFIFNDDNRSCYSSDGFDHPTPQFKSYNPYIAAFCVPLHKKIYMNATQAMTISHYNSIQDFKFKEEVVFRTYLASGNTFKNALMIDDKLDVSYKEFFASDLCFPKFVWVTEISDKSTFESGDVNGIVILDATENGKYNHIMPFPPIFSAYDDQNTFFDAQTEKFRKNALSLHFKMKSFSNL